MAETPARALAGFMAKYTPAMAKEGRAALARMRKLVPGAVQFVYDNWNGLVVGFGPTERPSEAVVSMLMTAGSRLAVFHPGRTGPAGSGAASSGAAATWCGISG